MYSFNDIVDKELQTLLEADPLIDTTGKPIDKGNISTQYRTGINFSSQPHIKTLYDNIQRYNTEEPAGISVANFDLMLAAVAENYPNKQAYVDAGAGTNGIGELLDYLYNLIHDKNAFKMFIY
jgi:hypothetical protein